MSIRLLYNCNVPYTVDHVWSIPTDWMTFMFFLLFMITIEYVVVPDCRHKSSSQHVSFSILNVHMHIYVHAQMHILQDLSYATCHMQFSLVYTNILHFHKFQTAYGDISNMQGCRWEGLNMFTVSTSPPRVKSKFAYTCVEHVNYRQSITGWVGEENFGPQNILGAHLCLRALLQVVAATC